MCNDGDDRESVAPGDKASMATTSLAGAESSVMRRT